jgi:HEAT repeat protein
VQAQAIKALEKIGPKAKAALPALNRFASSQNEDLRTAAKKAIAAIEP